MSAQIKSEKPEPTSWTEDAGGLGREPIPIEPFVSREFFEQEREKIFKRCWLNIGRVEDVPEPGDYFLRELVVCEKTLLV